MGHYLDDKPSVDEAAGMNARECAELIVGQLTESGGAWCEHIESRLLSLLPPAKPQLERGEMLQHYNVGKSCVGRDLRQLLIRHRGLHIIAARRGNCVDMGTHEAAMSRLEGIMEREGLWHDVVLWRDRNGAHSSIPVLDVGGHSPTGIEWGYGGSGPFSLAADVLVNCALSVQMLQEELSGIGEDFKTELIARIPRYLPESAFVICRFSNSSGKWEFGECPPDGKHQAGRAYIPARDVIDWVNSWRLRAPEAA